MIYLHLSFRILPFRFIIIDVLATRSCSVFLSTCHQHNYDVSLLSFSQSCLPSLRFLLFLPCRYPHPPPPPIPVFFSVLSSKYSSAFPNALVATHMHPNWSVFTLVDSPSYILLLLSPFVLGPVFPWVSKGYLSINTIWFVLSPIIILQIYFTSVDRSSFVIQTAFRQFKLSVSTFCATLSPSHTHTHARTHTHMHTHTQSSFTLFLVSHSAISPSPIIWDTSKFPSECYETNLLHIPLLIQEFHTHFWWSTCFSSVPFF